MSTRKSNERTFGPTRAEVLPVCPSCRANKCSECTSDDCGCSKPYHVPLGESVEARVHAKKHDEPPLLVGPEPKDLPAAPENEQLDLPLPPRSSKRGSGTRAAKKPIRAAWRFSKMNPKNRTQ